MESVRLRLRISEPVGIVGAVAFVGRQGRLVPCGPVRH